MRGWRAAATTAALCLLAVTTGCTSGEDASGAPAGTTTTSASSTSPPRFAIAIDRPVTRTLDVADAVPARFAGPPGSLVVRVSADTRLQPLGMDGQGRLLALRIPAEPKDSQYERITRTTTIGLWHAGRFTAVARSGVETAGALKGRRRQVYAITEAGDQLVWAETPSTDLDFAEWSIRSADLRTHVVHDVAHSAVLDGRARLLDVVGQTRPVVVRGWVYWATAVPRKPRPDPRRASDWEFDVQRTWLATPGRPQTVARNAVMPDALGDSVVYAAYGSGTPGVYEIHRQAVDGDRADRVIAKGYRSGTSWLTNLAASGHLVAWTAQSPSLAKEGWVDGDSLSGRLFVLDVSTGEVTAVVTRNEAGANASVEFTRSGVAWGNGSGSGDAGEYVLDTGTATLRRLGSNAGLSAVIADPGTDEICWATAGRGARDIRWRHDALTSG